MGGVSEPLIRWFEQHRRLLPFRQEPSAYHIWISEIMLQQTRVSAALPYYERFVVELPDPAALAACEPDRLRKLWQGLGYYSRAANLQKAAGILCDRYGGELPADYDALRALPGIGDYTAGAIASIAFGIPVPAVDGNVLRVFARLTNDDSDITRPETKRAITRLVMEEMPRDRPGAYNEALMELGALVCLPNGAPRCGECPLAGQCAGRAAGRAETLPNKPPKPAKTVVPVTVALITGPRGVLLQRRAAKGLLAGLWQPPAFEADHPLTREELDARLRALGLAVRWTGTLPPARHVFTHRVWQLSGFCAASEQEVLPGTFVWADLPALEREYSVPSAFSAYVSEGKIREKQEENARILT